MSTLFLTKRVRRGWGSLICLGLIWGCASLVAYNSQLQPDCPSAATCLSKGWSGAERQKWYNTSQGSRLFPEPWSKALLVEDTGDLFWGRENFSQYGYLWENSTSELPIGFPLDPDQKRGFSWVGMNCAACHTAQVEHDGRAYIVDGAPALADFQSMLRDLVSEAGNTLDSESAFHTFAQRVIPGSDEREIAQLKNDLEDWVTHRHRLLRRNDTPVAYGYGRLDAIGHILNKVSYTLSPEEMVENHPSDAPVSYPFIWNARQQERLQWNGLVERDFALFEDTPDEIEFGGLGRNIGQVIGVFGEQTTGETIFGLAASSIQLKNLIELERVLGKLHSPEWPDEFGAIDRSSAEFARGKQLFQDECASCHKHLEPNDLSTREKNLIVMQDIFAEEAGTDPWMACNATMHTSFSGPLKGRNVNLLPGGGKLKEVEATSTLLASMVTRNIVHKSPELVEEVAITAVERVWRSIVGAFRRSSVQPHRAPGPLGGNRLDRLYDKKVADLAACKEKQSENEVIADLLKYKARPLNGIWATAPYLHNGSVPTLRDLLASPENRPDNFYVGSRQFDPVNVGFSTEEGDNASEFNVTFTYRAGTDEEAVKVIPGNDNAGHVYGTGFCKGSASPFEEESKDCKAMLLYLKSL